MPRTVGRVLPLTLLWLVAGTGLAAITTRVRDWYAMPNELLNEHRAISVAQNALALAGAAPAVRRLVRPALPGADRAHVPRRRRARRPSERSRAERLPDDVGVHSRPILLARRVTDSRLIRLPGRRALGLHAVDLLRDAPDGRGRRLPGVPLGAARDSSAPWWRRRGDVTRLALGAIALAFLARPQLGVLAIVLPIAVVAYEIGAAGRPAGRGAQRVRWRTHRLARLSSTPSGSSSASASLASGRLAGALGVYGATVSGNLVPHGIPKSLAWHLALLLARAWASCRWSPGSRGCWRGFFRPPGRPEQHAFACLGAIASVAVLLQVTIFDLRFIDGLVLDRYLIYLVPDRVARLRLRPPGFARPHARARARDRSWSQPVSRSAQSRPSRSPASTRTRRSRPSTHRSSRRPGLSAARASCSRAEPSCSS